MLCVRPYITASHVLWLLADNLVSQADFRFCVCVLQGLLHVRHLSLTDTCQSRLLLVKWFLLDRDLVQSGR